MPPSQTQAEALNILARYLQPLVDNNVKTASGPTQAQVEHVNKSWRDWLTTIFPNHVRGDFAFFHEQFWDYIWDLRLDESPLPYVAIWSRGFAKSSSVELSVAMLGARKIRKYCLYISATQDKAVEHVSNIAELLENPTFASYYPQTSARKKGKFGGTKGWKIGLLRAANGFNVRAVGLDKAIRGAKLDKFRPDLIILDDIDELDDTPKAIEDKVEKLTKTILPAGSRDVAIIFIQNMIKSDGIAAKLVYNRADFLTHKILSGPYPALKNFTYEHDIETGRYKILTGEPTWPYVTLEICQAFINLYGISAFLSEYQHEVDVNANGLFNHIKFRHISYKSLPDLVRCVVWVDPAVTDTNKSDCHGIQCDGIDDKEIIYRLYSWESRSSPRDTLLKAITIAQKYNAHHIGVETDQGGDLWEETYDSLWEELLSDKTYKHEKIAFTSEKAGMHVGNKVHRATLMLADYETGQIVHVINDENTHLDLERAMRRFPDKPLDLVDASGWSWRDLRSGGNVIEYVANRQLPPVQINAGNRVSTKIFGRQRYNIFDNKQRVG